MGTQGTATLVSDFPVFLVLPILSIFSMIPAIIVDNHLNRPTPVLPARAPMVPVA